MEIKAIKVIEAPLSFITGYRFIEEIMDLMIDDDGELMWGFYDSAISIATLKYFTDFNPEMVSFEELYQYSLTIGYQNDVIEKINKKHELNKQYSALLKTVRKKLREVENRNNKSSMDKFFEILTNLTETMNDRFSHDDLQKAIELLNKSETGKLDDLTIIHEILKEKREKADIVEDDIEVKNKDEQIN